MKNPVASLLNDHKLKTTGTRIKDKIVDLKIKGIAINQHGQIGVDAKVNAFKMVNKALSALQGKISLPAIDESLLVEFGIIPPSKGTDAPLLSDLNERFNIRRLLRHLGHITEPANYSLEITGDKRTISARDDGKNIQGEEKRLDARITGAIDLNHKGDALIIVDKSPVNFSLGDYRVEGRLKIDNLGSRRPTRVDMTAKIAGSSKALVVDGFCRESVKKVFPERSSFLKPETEQVKPEKDVHYEISADKVSLRSNVHINAKLSSSNPKIKGTLASTLSSTNPYVKIDDNGAQFTGTVEANFNLKKLHYSKHGLKGTKGSTNVRVEPDKKTLEIFPEIKPTEWKYGFRIGSEDRARIKVPEFGAARFVSPVKNLEAHYDRVDTLATKENIHDIGSESYFRHIEKFTGAKLRKATKLEWLVDGKESMDERLRLIESAKSHICLQSFEFRDDATGWKTARALVNAKNRGVKVHVIVDSIGNIKAIKELAQAQPIYDYLKQNDIPLHLYNDNFEQALRTLFRVTETYPHVFDIPEKKSFHNISGMINFLKEVLDIIEKDEYSPLSAQHRKELQNALHLLYGGSEGDSTKASISELRDVLSQPIVKLPKLLSALKRMGDINYRSHEKYFIIDNATAIIGGMNIADNYLGGTNDPENVSEHTVLRFRDTDLRLEGEAVSDIYKNFRRNWMELTQERLPYQKPIAHSGGDYAVSIIDHRPKEEGDHKIANFYLYNLRSLKAGEKAWFETAYFLPRGALRPLQRELVNAAKRGVDVRILTNSAESSDFSHLVEAAIFDYRELLRAGARIFERTTNQMVHAKVAILGHTLCTVGSANLDNRSETLDREVLCAIFNEAKNSEMSAQLERDMFEQSNEIKLETIKNMPIKNELKAAGMHLLSEII